MLIREWSDKGSGKGSKNICTRLSKGTRLSKRGQQGPSDVCAKRYVLDLPKRVGQLTSMQRKSIALPKASPEGLATLGLELCTAYPDAFVGHGHALLGYHAIIALLTLTLAIGRNSCNGMSVAGSNAWAASSTTKASNKGIVLLLLLLLLEALLPPDDSLLLCMLLLPWWLIVWVLVPAGVLDAPGAKEAADTCSMSAMGVRCHDGCHEWQSCKSRRTRL